jgi:integrase
VLRQSLQQAVLWSAIPRNPADLVKPPRVERKQMMVLDIADAADVIEDARSYTNFIPIVLAMLCGMRRGEIAALRWRSLDLDAGQLAVVASTEQTKAGCREKDAKSGRCRTIALPALVVTELRRHRIEQAQAMLAIGVRVTTDHHVTAPAEQHHARRYAVHEEARQQGPSSRYAALARGPHTCCRHSPQDRQ